LFLRGGRGTFVRIEHACGRRSCLSNWSRCWAFFPVQILYSTAH
jgi:hypothetical protein